jgi:hypothetical protein
MFHSPFLGGERQSSRSDALVCLRDGLLVLLRRRLDDGLFLRGL